MEVHAGDKRNGNDLREKLKEATQSERIQAKKAAMSAFFKPKTSAKSTKKSDDSSNEKTDSLLLFSGFYLLFHGFDEAGTVQFTIRK